MLKEYMSKLPFLQPPKPRRRPAAPPVEEEPLWPEGDPFASEPREEEAAAEQMEEPVPQEQPDPLAAGADAYRSGDYRAALEIFLRAAEQGHPASQFLCGQMYRRGLGRRPTTAWR